MMLMGKQDVFFAFPDVGQGTSGGSAFRADEDPRACQVVAMYVGYQSNKGGAGLSRLVPPDTIKDWVERVVGKHA